jgi:hypothetical protein
VQFEREPQFSEANIYRSTQPGVRLIDAPFRGGLAKPYSGRGLIQNSDSAARRAMKEFNQS